MLTNAHISTVVLTLVVAATAIGVMVGIDPADVKSDLRTIEATSAQTSEAAGTVPEVSTATTGLFFDARAWVDEMLAKVSEPLD